MYRKLYYLIIKLCLGRLLEKKVFSSIGDYIDDLLEIILKGVALSSLLSEGSSIINPLPDDKSLALSKLKAFADDYFIVAKMVQFL